MQRPTALLLALAGVAVLIALFFVLRPGDDSDEASTTPTTTQPETETTPPTTGVETSPPPPPAPPLQTIRIVVRGGTIVGALRHATIPKGRRVRLLVSADVADEVHLHGYDISRDVAPGRPARITFRATITGRFEVELEDRGFQIADLEVQP